MIRGINEGIGTAPGELRTAQKKRLKDACEEFDSIMTNYLLKSMRQTVDRAEKPDQAREIFEGFYDEAVSKELAKRQGSGLADALYKQLSPQAREATKK